VGLYGSQEVIDGRNLNLEDLIVENLTIEDVKIMAPYSRFLMV